jgi:hypothetical protein
MLYGGRCSLEVQPVHAKLSNLECWHMLDHPYVWITGLLIVAASIAIVVLVAHGPIHQAVNS